MRGRSKGKKSWIKQGRVLIAQNKNVLTQKYANCLISNWSRTIRSPIAVSASACVFILVGSIERFIVLDGLEKTTERLRSENDLLRDKLIQTEAYVYSLNATLADFLMGTGSVPINGSGNSDTGAT